MGSFIWFILDALLGLMSLAILISVIVSWLVAFQVINTRNQVVWQIVRTLEAVTRPLMAPFRKVIPPLGGMDLSPIFALLVIEGVRRYLLPMAMRPLVAVAG